MAEDNDSDDQLDQFIHSYSYSDYDGQADSSSDEEDVSCSDSSGSEPPEDPSAEAEDMAIYDLYNNSARPSPQPPSSPMLQDAPLELDSMLDTIPEESKSLSLDWRKRRRRGQTSVAAPAHPSGAVNPEVVVDEDSSESGIETSDDDEKSRE